MIRLLCLAALLVPATAIAGESSAPAKPATTTASTEDDSDKLVCKRVITIGSNIPGKKVCVSKRDHDAAQRVARDEVEKMSSSGGHASGN